MKSKLYFLVFLSVMVSSCSKDDNTPNQPQTVYLRSIYRTYDTLAYNYSGGKVSTKVEIRTTSPGLANSWSYHYTSGRIDSIIRSDGLTFVYYYSNDTLVKIQSRGRDYTTILFRYDGSNRVAEQHISYFVSGSHGEMYPVDYLFRFIYLNGNIDRCVEYQRPSVSSDYIPYDTATYTYDDKRNPFSVTIDPDIVFDPYSIPRDFRYYNRNNLLSIKHSNQGYDIFKMDCQYTYNADGYPVSRTTTSYYSTSTEYYNY